jgi:Flp pilus assembly protein TadG
LNDPFPPGIAGRSRGRGQAVVEFALVVPVFFLAVFGLFDVGRLVYTNSALSQAAREGARAAATEVAWVGSTAATCMAAAACPGDVAALQADVTSAVNRMTVGLGPVTAVHLSCNAGTAGDLAPSGAWTAPGGGGNGCRDGAGQPVGAAGQLVSVRVEYTYRPMTPVISSIVGTLSLSGSATMVVQ